jgi:hypothetical protein
MRYLNHKNFIRSKQSMLTSYVSNSLYQDQSEYLLKSMITKLQDFSDKRNIEVLSQGSKSYLVKTSSMRHRNESFRTTLGIKRRESYDWNAAEIFNQLELSHLSYVPGVIAYSYKRNKFGFVIGMVLVTEYIDNVLNVDEFINQYPAYLNDVLVSSFDLIKLHLEAGFVHLDIWAGNILVRKDLSQAWLIDFEYCKFNSTVEIEKKMGFCLGFFYKRNVCDRIVFSSYLKVIESWVYERNILIDFVKMLEYCKFASHNDIGRKERFEYM